MRREVVLYGLAVIAVAVAWRWLDTQRFVVVSVCVSALCAIFHGQRRVEDVRSDFLRLVLTSMGARVVANGAGPLVTRNALGAKLVGWKQVESAGRPSDAVFRTVGDGARVPLE